ncbi:MAG: hypothetical protein AAGF12_38615 [Myxococcota bacterium]
MLLPFQLPDAVATAWTGAALEEQLASETALTQPAGTLPTLPVLP